MTSNLKTNVMAPQQLQVQHLTRWFYKAQSRKVTTQFRHTVIQNIVSTGLQGLKKERQNSNSEKLSQGKDVFISEVSTLWGVNDRNQLSGYSFWVSIIKTHLFTKRELIVYLTIPSSLVTLKSCDYYLLIITVTVSQSLKQTLALHVHNLTSK